MTPARLDVFRGAVNMPALAAKPFAARVRCARAVARQQRAARQVIMGSESIEELKQRAAFRAVEYVESDSVIGLGTGSTAAYAVDRIGELLSKGDLKNIKAIPTSIRTYEQAKALGIPLTTLDEHSEIEVAIDGADEVDPNLDVVKGRGGALLREKMVEKASKKFVCIVDDTKLVEGLGGSQLAMPVEIVQFCHKYTLNRLANLPEVKGCEAKLRMEGDKPYVTDNSNYIVDLYFKTPIQDANAAARAILDTDGVVDHGLFMNMVDVCIVAGGNGVEVKERPNPK